jgi:xylan 1,4-beta-xylosidase
VAGLTHYYNQKKFHLLAVTWHELHGRVLTVFSCAADWPDGRLTFPLDAPIVLPAQGPVRLAMEVDRERLQFQFTTGSDPWRDVGPVLDASAISDEAGGGTIGAFTGAFVGMVAFDMSGSACAADFASFDDVPSA